MAFTTVVPKALRSAGVIGPSPWASVPAGSINVELRALMNNPDIRDTALELTYQITGSLDGGVTSYLIGSSVWHGGVLNRDGTFSPPSQEVSTSPMPTHIHVSAVLPRDLNIGLEVEILPEVINSKS